MMLRSILSVLRNNSLRRLKLRNVLLLFALSFFVLLLLYTNKNLKEIDKISESIQQPQQKSIQQPMNEGQFTIGHHAEVVSLSASKTNGNINGSFGISMLPIGKKIDWHNYTQMKYEASRTGIGEQGKPAFFPEGQEAYERSLYSVNGFNAALSDLIPLNRSLPDTRHPGCRKRTYIESLPTVSVVVPFHNEHWSTLLRTAFSVLYRSPKDLIKEIILVDDGSTKDFLGNKLNAYLDKNMPKVKIKRMIARAGLITARLLGAKKATGDVLVFLDSHTEVNVNWLPPLLEPIALDYRTVVCPFIDVVAYDTFEYRAQDEGARGAFDWEFFYKRLPLLPKDVANMPEPFQSPVMSGGLFAISRKWFWELGGYDPQLDIWGGEQYEISFKNYRRVAEVWMDEYAKYLYKRKPYYRSIYPGDLSAQRELRRRLNCKPFKWFMTQIAFDLPSNFPLEEPSPYATGKIRAHKGDWCIVASSNYQNLELANCTDFSREREWVLTWHKDIRPTDRNVLCWDVPDSTNYSPIKLYNCHGGGGNQHWSYDHALKQFRHLSGVCLDWHPVKKNVFINHCLVSAFDKFHEPHSQQWFIDFVDIERLKDFDKRNEPVTGPLP